MTEAPPRKRLDTKGLRRAVGVLRRLAVMRVLGGEEPTSVSGSFGVSPQTLYRWLRKYRAGGLGALAPRTATGRPRLLAEDAARLLRNAVLGRRPSDWGIPHALWTQDHVRAFVRKSFGVEIGRVGAARALRRVGLALTLPLQEPPFHAMFVAASRERQLYRRLRRGVAKDKGSIVFLRLGHDVGRKGATLASAMTSRGEFFAESLSGDDSRSLEEFLHRFAKGSRGPVVFLQDVPAWSEPLERFRRTQRGLRGTRLGSSVVEAPRWRRGE